MRKVVLHTYGKLNLSLGITGVRPDGYHLLDMVMQTVSVCDTLTVCVTQKSGITLTCSDTTLPINQENLAYKAAVCFLQESGKSQEGISIDIVKRIPHGGGMAGGSSNAAGVLYGLNLLFDEPFSAVQLKNIGLKLGADVPYCLTGGTVRVQGIGELLTPIVPLKHLWFVVVKPKVGVATAEAYKAYDKTSHTISTNNKQFIKLLQAGQYSELYPLMQNALEEAVTLPELDILKKALVKQGAKRAVMTGSGACVFGVFESEKQAAACQKALEDETHFIALCRPVDRGIELLQAL